MINGITLMSSQAYDIDNFVVGYHGNNIMLLMTSLLLVTLEVAAVTTETITKKSCLGDNISGK